MDLNAKTKPKRQNAAAVHADEHADTHANAIGIAFAVIVKLRKCVLMNNLVNHFENHTKM